VVLAREGNIVSDYRTRLDKRSKKKTNNILNIMIGVVVLLILIVGATIFLSDGKDKNTASNEVVKEEPNKDTSSNDENSKDNVEKEDKQDSSINENESEDENENDNDTSSNKDNEEDSSATEEKSEEIASNVEDKSKLEIEESDEPNVKKSIVHPEWKPIGTEQTGEHVSQYDDSSIDWDEKVKALSYATGIPEGNMTVWYIEGNGSPQKSIGTVSAKDNSTVYRVYLQWIDGQGWKPTKMQELVENDKD
jgi:flagellar basal body-associated protein FliL